MMHTIVYCSRQIQKMGICLSSSGTLHAIDQLGQEHDHDAKVIYRMERCSLTICIYISGEYILLIIMLDNNVIVMYLCQYIPTSVKSCVPFQYREILLQQNHH